MISLLLTTEKCKKTNSVKCFPKSQPYIYEYYEYHQFVFQMENINVARTHSDCN